MKKLTEIRSPGRLKKNLDQYLFRLAFPSGKKEYEGARDAMLEIANPSAYNGNIAIKQYHPIPEIIGSFSYAIAQWLNRRFPGVAELESSTANSETVKLFFRRLLPRCEYETISSGNTGLLKRIDLLKGNGSGNRLHWLLELMEDQLQDDREKEMLFEQMQVFIRFRLPETDLHPAWGRAPVSGIGYHRKQSRKINVSTVSRLPLPQAIALSVVQKNKIIDLARASLLFLYRETEPFTYADPDGLELFEMENGWSVALFSMQPGRRLSTESYIGYLAFRNAVPLAYGGGWLFGKRCQFGINIFPAFRGGNSLQLLAQLLRVYHQRFGAARFVVKPYQFGMHNPEAIRSGAFWFYYKAGFRPVNQEQAEIAKTEIKKKKNDPHYRSSPGILKGFTSSSLVLQIEAEAIPLYDAARLSEAVTAMIRDKYAGDRRKAIKAAVPELQHSLHIPDPLKWKALEKRAFEEWSLLLHGTADICKWTSAEQQQLLTLIRSRARGPETDFIKSLQDLDRLWQDWNRFVSRLPDGME